MEVAVGVLMQLVTMMVGMVPQMQTMEAWLTGMQGAVPPPKKVGISGMDCMSRLPLVSVAATAAVYVSVVSRLPPCVQLPLS